MEYDHLAKWSPDKYNCWPQFYFEETSTQIAEEQLYQFQYWPTRSFLIQALQRIDLADKSSELR